MPFMQIETSQLVDATAFIRVSSLSVSAASNAVRRLVSNLSSDALREARRRSQVDTNLMGGERKRASRCSTRARVRRGDSEYDDERDARMTWGGAFGAGKSGRSSV